MQNEYTGLERILNIYGWPTLILIIVLLALRSVFKSLFPIASNYVTSLEAKATAAQELFKEQTKQAIDRAERDQEVFLKALYEQRDAHERALKEQASITAEAVRKQSEATVAAITKQTETLTQHTETLKRLQDTLERKKE